MGPHPGAGPADELKLRKLEADVFIAQKDYAQAMTVYQEALKDAQIWVIAILAILPIAL